MIPIPPNAKVTEWPASTTWMDEEGILVSVTKPAPPRTFEEMRQTIEKFEKTFDGKKICMLVDVTHIPRYANDVRDYAAEEFPKFIKAVAMVTTSPLGKMMANLFFTIKHQPYPTKIFSNEAEARQWLRQYL